MADCETRLLRTIVPPALSLAEDPARLLRGLRLAARAGLEIEGETGGGCPDDRCRAWPRWLRGPKQEGWGGGGLLGTVGSSALASPVPALSRRPHPPLPPPPPMAAAALEALVQRVVVLPQGRLQMELGALMGYGAAARSLRLLWQYGALDLLLPHHVPYLRVG